MFINMKQYFKNIVWYFIIYITVLTTNSTFAEWEWAPTWLLDWVKTNWDKAASVRIREWDLHLDDIPNVIKWIVDILIGLAGTIAVIFVIYWAYRLLFWSLKWDHTKWRETIIMALTGFVISILAWFIVKVIFTNLVEKPSTWTETTLFDWSNIYTQALAQLI